ncbi:hypothetical protein [Spirillospora sp. NPDC048819]|uniref:hypothetical protein n=1 Tax=Spirillospora sp. NPDC048819 TaxID=3155268 RepID=UPI0033FE2B82
MGNTAADRPEPDRNRNDSGGEVEGTGDKAITPDRRLRSGEGPDVYLDVPLLKVDEISLEVENLEAHVSLVAQVLDLLRLNVGADVFLGRVKLEIKGVEAQAQLDVRLDNVAIIVDRVLTTLDRNPEILQHIGRGVEAAARDIGAGTGTAVGEVGKGAKGAVQDVGRGAGGAVESVGRGAGGAVEDVGRGAGAAVEDVGEGAGGAVKDVGEGTAGAVEDVGEGVRDVGEGAAGAVEGVGEGTGRAAETAAGGVAAATEEAGKAAEGATGETGKAAEGATGETGKAAEGVTGTEPKEPDDSTENGNGNGRQDEPETKPETDQKSDQETDDGAEPSNGEQEITALKSALHETEQSVRELGRALFRMVSAPRSPDRGDE